MTVVVGTKLDLVQTNGRQVAASEGKSFAIMQHQKQLDRANKETPNAYLAKVQGHESYFETSSKTGEGVTELFQYVERNMLAYLQKTAAVSSSQTGTKGGNRSSTIQLDHQRSTQTTSQSSGCCKN